MKIHSFYFFLFIVIAGFSQQKYPQNYFQNPLDIPLYLSGTFGELRTNHFHSGLDLKTQQREGLNVFASAEGYVSRIKVSHWGYGKALYITHPNGYTTVYAHLKKFSPKIESYLKQKQYQKESFEIQLYPKSDELQIAKGEIVAFSGSTGGFVGPHLHFEIRDGKSNPINPLLFGIKVKDDKRPSINTLVAYPLDSLSQINTSNIPLKIGFRTQKEGVLLSDKITAFGKIGFGVYSYDRLTGAANKNGIYSLEMNVNGSRIYYHDVETFSFAETKHLNLLIDYDRYIELGEKIQRCFVVEENPLSLYKNVKNRGELDIKDNNSYTIEIIAKDFKGNQKKMLVPIQGKKDSILIRSEEEVTDYKISAKEFNKFTKQGVTIAFPKNTFYKDLYLKFKVEDGKASIHSNQVLLKNSYTLTFDVDQYTASEKKQLFIANYSSKGYPNYVDTKKKDKTFYTKTKSLGKFKLLKDSIPPKLRLHNIKDKQWVTNFKRLVLKVSDDLSGLKSYRGEVDGDWILLEYSPKHGTLTYDFADIKFNTAEHKLKVIVEDNVGNTKTLESTFYRKK
ncbi:M23 family metallopeptidase [Urechidicola vernalis]|uniref:M23 family metallopeptidase n=1 Tax=Urechidicola vernalis TaxID=3075600 RepID=A0ABU2Y267_9FLAO|nr:M23 family metallopeptidase [Urechidicola sp. P050]MDT0552292.1 M23 family metallopeptidase [Urechidicola sp. P050]